MPLTTKEKQALKAKAHHLKPIVIIGGKGLTDTVMAEIDRALYDHELIKIKIHGQEKDVRKAVCADICQELNAELLQLIGNTGILFRRSTKKEAH